MHIRILYIFCLYSSLLILADEPHRLGILTYNIHHAGGLDGKVDYERIAGIIRKTDADIIALQEVDNQTTRTQGVDQAKKLASILGLQVVFGKALNFQGGTYGLAILSRGEIKTSRTFALPYRVGQEPRIVLEAIIDLGDGVPLINIFNAHLCHLSEDTRSEQVQRILQVVPGSDSMPVFLVGDFNARPDSTPMKLLWEKSWEDLLETHNGIDYLLSSSGTLVELKSSRIVDAPIASDHKPVFAEVLLK
ncbi:MAG: hypothetical protein HOH33_15700 [Verrucomicrobia bacterium]|jgi:endonuclease/exonuclease/phosphatase family metal-dependent hydrolase|nr:hypothetical protein [Verrucomicrobiota bacterium]